MYKTKDISLAKPGDVVRFIGNTSKPGSVYPNNNSGFTIGSLYIVRDYTQSKYKHHNNLAVKTDDRKRFDNGWQCKYFELLDTEIITTDTPQGAEVVCVSISDSYHVNPKIGSIYTIKDYKGLDWFTSYQNHNFKKEDFRVMNIEEEDYNILWSDFLDDLESMIRSNRYYPSVREAGDGLSDYGVEQSKLHIEDFVTENNIVVFNTHVIGEHSTEYPEDYGEAINYLNSMINKESKWNDLIRDIETSICFHRCSTIGSNHLTVKGIESNKDIIKQFAESNSNFTFRQDLIDKHESLFPKEFKAAMKHLYAYSDEYEDIDFDTLEVGDQLIVTHRDANNLHMSYGCKVGDIYTVTTAKCQDNPRYIFIDKDNIQNPVACIFEGNIFKKSWMKLYKKKPIEKEPEMLLELKDGHTYKTKDGKLVTVFDRGIDDPKNPYIFIDREEVTSYTKNGTYFIEKSDDRDLIEEVVKEDNYVYPIYKKSVHNGAILRFDGLREAQIVAQGYDAKAGEFGFREVNGYTNSAWTNHFDNSSWDEVSQKEIDEIVNSKEEPLKLEVGKTYKTRHGDIVSIFNINKDVVHPYQYAGSNGISYTENGRSFHEHETTEDIIEEVKTVFNEMKNPCMEISLGEVNIDHNFFTNSFVDSLNTSTADAGINQNDEGNVMSQDRIEIKVNGKDVDLGTKEAKVKSDFKKKPKVIAIYFKKTDGSFVEEVKFDSEQSALDSLSTSAHIDHKMSIYRYCDTKKVSMPIVGESKTAKTKKVKTKV